MRITVGGLLLATVTVVGAYIAYDFLTKPEAPKKALESVSVEPTTVPSLPESSISPFTDKTADVVTNTDPQVSGSVPSNETEVLPLPTIPIQKSHFVTRPKRSLITVKKGQATKTTQVASPKPSMPKKISADSLVGSYVNVQLTSGNSVQGVLQGKTKTAYKVELPGLGTFEYPIERVKKISRAQ